MGMLLRRNCRCEGRVISAETSRWPVRLAASGSSAFTATKPNQLMNKHVVLLGDSVFANAAYVAGGPDVITQLRQRLPSTWRATLLAVDGSVMAAIPGQLERVSARSESAAPQHR